MPQVFYNDKLDADVQITAEEHIASLIFQYQEEEREGMEELGEEDCAELGRRILASMLRVFRPDLIDA